MRHDFTAMSTHALTKETLKRVDDVEDINAAAMRWCLWAVAGIAVPPIIALIIVPQYPLAVIAASIVCGAYPTFRWIKALLVCRRYTAEMNARTAELNRRNGVRS